MDSSSMVPTYHFALCSRADRSESRIDYAVHDKAIVWRPVAGASAWAGKNFNFSTVFARLSGGHQGSTRRRLAGQLYGL